MAFKALLAALPGHTETRVYAEVLSYTCSLLMAFKGGPARADPAVTSLPQSSQQINLRTGDHDAEWMYKWCRTTP